MSCRVHDTDDEGWTALFYAAKNGKISTVIKLLDECGANDLSRAGLEHQSDTGETAIFVAAANGSHNDRLSGYCCGKSKSGPKVDDWSTSLENMLGLYFKIVSIPVPSCVMLVLKKNNTDHHHHLWQPRALTLTKPFLLLLHSPLALSPRA